MVRPPEKPPSEPSLAMTRWQGIRNGTGLAPTARPTAREDLGLPMRFASAP